MDPLPDSMMKRLSEADERALSSLVLLSVESYPFLDPHTLLRVHYALHLAAAHVEPWPGQASRRGPTLLELHEHAMNEREARGDRLGCTTMEQSPHANKRVCQLPFTVTLQYMFEYWTNAFAYREFIDDDDHIVVRCGTPGRVHVANFVEMEKNHVVLDVNEHLFENHALVWAWMSRCVKLRHGRRQRSIQVYG